MLWTNPREIAGNGKDDDNNGYVDDVHGWDFIGGPGGKDIGKDTYEVTRLYARCTAGGSPPSNTTCSEVKTAFMQKRSEAEQQMAQIKQMDAAVTNIVAVLKREVAPDSLSPERVSKLKPIRTDVQQAQAMYISLVEQLMERYSWVGDKVHRRKMSREAARGVLPNSTETKIVVTGNARAWRTMLELRSSEGAELEIRRLAVATLRLLAAEAPGFFSDFEIYVGEDRREAARVGFHKV